MDSQSQPVPGIRRLHAGMKNNKNNNCFDELQDGSEED